MMNNTIGRCSLCGWTVIKPGDGRKPRCLGCGAIGDGTIVPMQMHGPMVNIIHEEGPTIVPMCVIPFERPIDQGPWDCDFFVMPRLSVPTAPR